MIFNDWVRSARMLSPRSAFFPSSPLLSLAVSCLWLFFRPEFPSSKLDHDEFHSFVLSNDPPLVSCDSPHAADDLGQIII